MPRIGLLSVTLFFTLLSVIHAQESEERKSYTTAWREGEIVLDGKLDDDAWDKVEWGGDFVGHRPDFNVEPYQQTKFKILYDAKFLYVGIRALDTEPEQIVKRMSRRDGFDGDFVEINIDSYNDKRTAFSFTASVSGVKGDEYVSNNGNNWDSTWDPIWYLRTSVDDEGWVAEFKIPLSQLRFANKENHTWGIQFTRRIFRKEERSTWQAVDPNAPGWVHLFGELNGITGIKPQKQLEIQPYVLASLDKYPKEEENPFRDSGEEFKGNVGLDAKIGITSDITLDLTFNPDFGQVDADPSAVNLSAFQLFFRERRPFFLEGSNLLSFRTSGGTNNLFYSRRVGGRPHGYPENVEYIDYPNNTRILGAAKITGKNANGFSWGVLESLTNKERADVQYEDGSRGEEVVEPYTNFLVARAQQDIEGGKTVVGAIVTNVKRFDNRGNELEYLHDQATSAGIDLDHNFKDRKYGMEIRAMFSRVDGTMGAIYRTQTASERFFQRPDNNHKEVDSTRTSLIGSAATFAFGKRSGNWRWTVGSNYKSPELVLNDAGFLRQTDDLNNWFWTQYRVNKITNTFRWQNYNIYAEYNNDFGGAVTNRGINFDMNWEFKNYWGFGQGVWVGGTRVSNADLRGGPSIRYPGNVNYWYWIGTNSRKKVRVSFNNWFNWGQNSYTKSSGISLNINLRPMDAMQISISPSVNWNRDDLQYITQQDFENDTRYILGRVEQETYSMSVRANYNITPNLTLEFWGQPFIAAGDYSQFKRVHLPNAESYDSRFHLYEDSQIVFDEENSMYEIYENGSSDPDYTFDDPNFNVVQFRSNFVMRWEYIPGSTLFMVWANNGSYFDQSRNNSFNDLTSHLSGLTGNNTFLIKYTYRFIL
ncbi:MULTISPECIES: DUF5916 domain-containing protein [unclassified Ekhidna]|jgi:hypothetical protein|uniref:DUF5916 domain-containing protein n=1 Tax=unclassified Ekhidna TaxID=2632188 RepID=UPI0032DF9536